MTDSRLTALLMELAAVVADMPDVVDLIVKRDGCGRIRVTERRQSPGMLGGITPRTWVVESREVGDG